MNRNSIFIGLFLAVFVFPTNNSLVFAKSCKDQKSDLRAEKKGHIKSLCEGEILPLLGQLTNHSRNREVNEHANAGFCRGGDWSVSTNPKGNCTAQKGHIRKKYNDKIESLKAFVVDTENAIEAQKMRVAEQERLAAEKAEALRPKLIEAGIEAAQKAAKVIEDEVGYYRSELARVEWERRNASGKWQWAVEVDIRAGMLETAVTEAVNKMNLKSSRLLITRL